MKKLFAIVLVLAMALAIAVPALAAEGWDKPDPVTVPADDFEADVTKYEYYESTSAGFTVNGKYFAEWPETKAVAKDIMGRAYAELSIPSKADIATRYPGVYADNMIITVTITNVKRVAIVDTTGPDFYPHQSTTNINAKNVYKETFDDFGYGTDWDKMFVFTAASDDKVVVTLNVTAGDTELPGSFQYNKIDISVTQDAANYTFTSTKGTVEFQTIAASDKVEKIFVTAPGAGSTEYEVFKAPDGSIAFKNGGTSLYSTDADLTAYNAPKAVFDFYMSALGFSWDNTTKFMNEDLIVKNLFKTIDGSVSATFPAGYVAITPPAIEPPQTGDATTVVGFVMIALALVAAAYVTVKKVNA